MKRLVLGAVAALAMGGAAWADPVEGIWQTEPDAGSYAHVEMGPCGAAICGTFLKTFKDGGEYQSPNLGKKVVIDMVPNGDGSYAGQVWRPSNDKVYTGKMQLSGNSLAMSGCVMGGLICSKQTWTRVK
ncbi:DUF2147 domain-containing protein [Seohaeicola zhoushanensis]|uniref:DUF2147 domain-containing protein n=1 Tax=Seohaeicola zhoushanensis TaxID=1569283 RepID=A0A8J3H1G9_9RHOB|nr:DUF2147 domain-containing protein [Seohaeicola zhoushanensis]GHF72575.1 hypothetical protein GCM10017056_49360 [Seohaeicola zhoushanensis]